MERKITKICAKIGIAMSILSVVNVLLLGITTLVIRDWQFMQGLGWIFMVFEWFFVLGSLLFYLIDAILSVIKIFIKVDVIFNVILVLTVLSFGVVFQLAGGASFFGWLLLFDYLAIVTLELISVFRHKKRASA